jgi:hypothetical protein
MLEIFLLTLPHPVDYVKSFIHAHGGSHHMTFKFRIRPKTVEIEFEAGSIAEGGAILEQEGNAISNLFNSCLWIEDEGQTQTQDVVATPDATTTAGAEPPKKRGRKPKNQPDPATASAPPPMPVAPPVAPVPAPAPVAAVPAPTPPAPPAPPMPPAAAPAPLTIPTDGSIPAFLQRPAPVPAKGRLGPLVKAECEKRATGSPDNGQALADWLAGAGVVVPGAKFPDAMAVIELASDEQLSQVAAALGVQ